MLLFIIFLVLGLVLWNRHRTLQENEQILRDKVQYATMMRFTVRDEYMRTTVHAELRRNRQNPDSVDYTEIVFVYSSQEATQFKDHVLVAWPSRAPYDISPYIVTEGLLIYYNLRIRHNHPDIDFRDYGLPANEITMVDVVDNWEIINELIWKYGRR